MIKTRIGTDQGAYYDFYLTRDLSSLINATGLTVRDYSGLDYTKEIAQNLSIAPLPTNNSANSVIEYCVNRNKRNSDGSIDYSNMRWYTPAIDEIEEICVGGYSEFKVFQNKYYWSSQPAYKKRDATYTGHYVDSKGKTGEVGATGNFFSDDIARARATKCLSDGNGDFIYADSGSSFSWGTLTLVHHGYFNRNGNQVTLDEDNPGTYYEPPQLIDSPTDGVPESTLYQEGNQPRTAINRVRCVYKAD